MSLLELLIERPVAGGRMLARHDGGVVLVSGAVPGERVRARVEKTTRHVTFAAAVEVVESSPYRRPLSCDPECGGLAYAHVAYDHQRDLKSQVLTDAFRRIGKIALDAPVHVHASREHGYRVRARLHVRGSRAGFFREGTHDLCDASPSGQLGPEALTAVEALIAGLGARSQDCDAIVVSENVAATQRVLHVQARIGACLGDLAGVIDAPAGVSGVTTTDEEGKLVEVAGVPHVTDTAESLGVSQAAGEASLVWRRQATSFFQSNRYLVGTLLSRVVDFAAGNRVGDLYAGVGLFALALAARGSKVLAVEADTSSGADLEHNARPWGPRVRTVRASVEEALADAPVNALDAVIVDPPRTGLSPRALEGVNRLAAPRLVYVSCDPPTLARDAAALTSKGYTLDSIEAFDMFPNTAHIETAAVFVRREP